MLIVCHFYLQKRTNGTREETREALVADSLAFGIFVFINASIKIFSCAISVNLVNYSGLKQVNTQKMPTMNFRFQ